MLYLKNIRSSCSEIMDLSNVGDSVFHDDVESKSVEKKGIDLGYILNDLISFFNYKGKDKNITFNLKYENKGLPSPLILGVRKIREILQNVFNNSLEISDEGGKINVHVSFDKVKEQPLSYDIIIEVIDETDGIGLEFGNWRFNLRKSNTEPVIRLNVESKGDIALVEEKTKELLDLIRAE